MRLVVFMQDRKRAASLKHFRVIHNMRTKFGFWGEGAGRFKQAWREREMHFWPKGAKNCRSEAKILTNSPNYGAGRRLAWNWLNLAWISLNLAGIALNLAWISLNLAWFCRFSEFSTSLTFGSQVWWWGKGRGQEGRRGVHMWSLLLYGPFTEKKWIMLLFLQKLRQSVL